MIPKSTTLTDAGRSVRAKIAGVVAGLVVVAVLGWSFRFGDAAIVQGPDGSMFVTDVNGVAGLTELATAMGIETAPLTTELTVDDVGRYSTIVMVDPQPVGYTATELEALDAFVGQGGRLVIAGRPPREFLGRFLPADLSFGYRAQVEAPVVYPLGGVGGEVGNAGIRNIETDTPGLPLLGDPPVATAFARGDGVVIYLSDGSILHNRRLDRNGPWALAVLGRGPVLFDEVRHGFRPPTAPQQGIGLFAALPAPARRTIGLLALAGVIALVTYGRRWAPVEATDRVLPPARSEFTEALAGLLLRTGDLAGASGPLLDQVRLLARRALHLDSATAIDPADLAHLLELEEAAVRRGLDPRHTNDFLDTQHLLVALNERTPR